MHGWICRMVVRAKGGRPFFRGSEQASLRGRQWRRDLKAERASYGPLGQTLQAERTGLIQWEFAWWYQEQQGDRLRRREQRGSERKAGCSQDARLGFAERSPLPLCSTLCRGQELDHCRHGPGKRRWPPAPGMSSVSGKKWSDSGHSDSIKKKNSIDLYLLFLGILARTFPGTSPPLSRTGWGHLSLQILFG